MSTTQRDQQIRHARSRAGPALLVAAALLAGWAVVALATGGIRLTLGGFPVSSRDPVRPAVVALVLAVAAWRLDPRWTEARTRSALGALAAFRRRVVPLAAACVLVASIAFGGRAAIGPDAFGYISQSVLWQRGDSKIDQRFVAAMPWPDADWTFSPLGYRPGPDHTLVPTYPPGFPLLLAAVHVVSSWRAVLRRARLRRAARRLHRGPRTAPLRRRGG